ncbi:MAG TPA: hypothetical protein PKD90_07660, partial [Phnomibacter sp.]|nr:hypothetical protein [Phnomibacter sp.]
NPQPSYRGWISERDKGIGDAFNKGINKTNGSILLMLNAGDKLGETDTLQKVVNAFNKSPNIAWLHGMYLYQRAGIWVVLGKPFDPGKIYRGMRSVCHQTMYVKRTVYDKYGLYDNDLKIGMDFDFLIRIRNEKFLFLKEILAVFAPGGLSMEDFNKNLKENTRIIEKNIGISWKHRLWTIRLWMLNKILTSPIGKPLYWLKNKLGLARF